VTPSDRALLVYEAQGNLSRRCQDYAEQRAYRGDHVFERALRAQLAETRQLLSLFGNQLAEMHKVVEAAKQWRSEREAATDRYRDDHEKALGQTTDNYDVWLSQNPHADHVGTVTVDGEVKR
jgi:hypothetical protein